MHCIDRIAVGDELIVQRRGDPKRRAKMPVMAVFTGTEWNAICLGSQAQFSNSLEKWLCSKRDFVGMEQCVYPWLLELEWLAGDKQLANSFEIVSIIKKRQKIPPVAKQRAVFNKATHLWSPQKTGFFASINLTSYDKHR